ncbi:MAG: FHA domain-containing protein, partial [Planctomycetota bacterium]
MPKQFILIGSRETFPVPPGESRIGSDAACQICIHGEGILPVHAYLYMDDAKLLIRPAATGSASSDSGATAITVNGQTLEGPMILTNGQAVSIGNVRLRLKVKAPRLWSRRWFRRLAYTGVGAAVLMLISYLFLIFVLLEPGRLKAKVSSAIATYLLRDETDIDFARANLFQGTLELKAIKVKDRASFANASVPFLKIASLTVRMSPWQMLGFCVSLPCSWFSELTDLQIVITEPETIILRSKADGVFSIEDIVAKYRRYKADMGVKKLSFQLEIKGGSVRLRDNFIPNIGETSLENINILLRQPLGEPLAIERCEMQANAIPAPTSSGQLALSGHIRVMNDECFLDIGKLSSDDLKLEMRNFNLARIFEHFGYAWEPYNANLKVVLGKPITGQVNLRLTDTQRMHVYGMIKSDSLLTIKEENRPLLGNIPMKLEYDVKLADNGNGYRPQGLNVKLRSGANVDDPRALYLVCGVIGQLNANGASDYSVYLQHCDLEKLVGTDIGQRLGLDGRLGGRLEGNVRVCLDAVGRLIM